MKGQWKKTDGIIVRTSNPETFSPELSLKTSPVLPSNDSENIAKLLENFEYDLKKTENILKKYDTLLGKKSKVLVKSLKIKK